MPFQKKALFILIIIFAFDVRSALAFEKSFLIGANVEFYEEGLYLGTLNGKNPDSKRKEFSSLIHEHGINAIRFPGGLTSGYYDGLDEDVTRFYAKHYNKYWLNQKSKRANSFYVSIFDFLDFCKEADVEPIIQLNTFNQFAVEDGAQKVYDLTQDTAHYRDAAARVEIMLAEMKKRGYTVNYFEIGNEEYAEEFAFAPENYARLAAEYIKVIKKIFPSSKVLVTLGDSSAYRFTSRGERWAKRLLSSLADLNMTRKIDYFTLHYVKPDGINKILSLIDRYGFKDSRVALTETSRVSNTEDYWNRTPVFEYAADYAVYLKELYKIDKVDIVLVHNLMSYNYGLFKFNEENFNPYRYNDSLGYLKTPTAVFLSLLRDVNGKMVSIEDDIVCDNRGSACIYIVVNKKDRSERAPLNVSFCKGERVSVKRAVMRADSLNSTVANVEEYFQDVTIPDAGIYSVEVPPISIVVVTVFSKSQRDR